MAEVNVAYDALADPKLQAKYRAKLRKTHTPCGACEEAGGRWKQKGFKGRTFETCRHCGGSGMVEKK